MLACVYVCENVCGSGTPTKQYYQLFDMFKSNYSCFCKVYGRVVLYT